MIERRQAVSDWLMNVVAASVKQDLTVEDSIKNVFTLLTGQCVQEACQQAQSIGENTELKYFLNTSNICFEYYVIKDLVFFTLFGTYFALILSISAPCFALSGLTYCENLSKLKKSFFK